MLTAPDESGPIRPPSDAEAQEAHIQFVVETAPFLRAETHRKLLLYLWAQRAEEISEYTIATEALGRRANFDSQIDASVRVQISRLRKKLKDLYDANGSPDGYMLHIPMGTHVLTIERVEPSAVERSLVDSSQVDTEIALPFTSTEVPTARRSRWIFGLAAACFVLCAVVGVLIAKLNHYQSAFVPAQGVATEFWATLLGKGNTFKIILPTPVFFNYPQDTGLHVRDVNVNDFEDWKTSRSLVGLAEVAGQPTLDQSYTVTSDTLAALELARYLDKVGMSEHIDFAVSSEMSMSLLEHSSVIAIGAYSTLGPFQEYLTSMNFSMAPHELWVTNAHPQPSERSRYDAEDQGFGRQLSPAIVAVLPGRAPGAKLIILQSRYTMGLVDFLTSKAGDTLFAQMYKAHGSPKYFEMVVLCESEGSHVIRSWPVAMHSRTMDAPSPSKTEKTLLSAK